ncbi:protein RER1-like [Symsagittifera roscoffensis]|uniref:protein RER1-like n=1 Tax=Symsagittifera roscoffensis TaxID=84072 RepID=UPI00307B6EF7
MGDIKPEEIVPTPAPLRLFNSIGVKYQYYLDKAVPYTTARWATFFVCFGLYVLRVYLVQGFHIISYGLAIYYLNLFLMFLTPKIDPAFAEMSEDDGMSLPTKSSNAEFRPFIRRLPEFKFWHLSTRAVIIATFITFFQVFNVPVFWPILVMYFIILFCLTMKRQIKHMIKYRYIPLTHGKKKYAASKETSSGAN